MYSKKRNQADGTLRPSSGPPQRLSSDMQHPEAESMMSSVSERSCLMQHNFTSPAGHTDKSTPGDHKYSVVAVGKRSSTHHQRIPIDAEERSKRSRIEYSDATVSGVTFQKDLNLYHTRILSAESDTASIQRAVRLHHDSVCLNSRRSTFVSRCSETELDRNGIRGDDADTHATFISSRVQENRGSMLPVDTQGRRDASVSSFSCYRQSRDDSHCNSRSTSVSSCVRDPSKTSPTLGQKTEARAWDRLISSKHVGRSPQRSSVESQHATFLNGDTTGSEKRHAFLLNMSTMRLKGVPADTVCLENRNAPFLNVDTVCSNSFPADTLCSENRHAPFLNVDTIHSKGFLADTMCSRDAPPSYVLSSGRLCQEEEARLGRRLPTIDDDFEEYFSSLML